jgi:conjugal transfer pilus assembly protein TraE
MLKQKYKSFLKDGIFKRQVWMVIAGVMLLSNLLLSAKMFSIVITEKTIIHPVSMMQEYSVQGDQVDPELIDKLAEEFLRARFLYNPKTVAKQFDNITKYFHPAIYGEKKSELDAEAAKIIRNDETSVFFPMGIHVKQLKAYIEAEIIGYLGKKPVTQGVKTYEVEFRNSGGRLWIYGWQQVVVDSSGKNYLPVQTNIEQANNDWRAQ